MDTHTSTKEQKKSDLLKAQPTSEPKACLFNLIVYTHEPRRTEYLKEVVKMIMSQLPCRIIFIIANPHSNENLLTYQKETVKSDKAHGIVCDQIIIEASGREINKVYFLLLPLFVPDLPIYLLWGQDPTTENSILPHLQYFATRLILDSEAVDDLQTFSRDILNRMQSTSIQVIDMNWGRIGGWREVLAQIFDSQERFQQFTAAVKIEIFYNDKKSDVFLHPETQALYLQAWIASRLGWHYQQGEKENNSQVLIYKTDQGNREIRLTPKTCDAFEAEEIVQVNVEGPDYACNLTRISADHVQVHTSNQYQCLLPFTLIMPTLQSGRNLMQEIFYQKVSDHYIPMLKLLSLIK